MCGIYGTTIVYTEETLRKKLDIFRFRGPDYTGMKRYNFPNGRLMLGHNRLSIIDLDSRSNQPFDYSNDISIVFNGEIYNYQELKRTYFQDRAFKTTSDTEVLCAMYEKFGSACTKYLNGMFSFVIYDKRQQILFGARDRLGKKPFFYHISNRGFEFASQLFPLCLGNDYTIDTDPYSIFKEVRKLRAGEQFEYNLLNGSMSVSKYWDIHNNSCGFTVPHSYQEALETVDGLLMDSVSQRLVADVPVGIFLSGGIDSSLVATYVSKQNKNVETFSVGFNESYCDESFYSKAVSEQLGLKYNHILCDSNAVLKMLDSLFFYYDEPMGDTSALATSLLAQEVRKSVTVALGGDGGDEIFWGYERYLNITKYRSILSLPLCIRKVVSSLLPNKYRKYSEAIVMNDMRDLYAYRSYYCNRKAFSFDVKECYYSLEDIHYLYENSCAEKAFSDFELKTYLNYAINTKVDRATMKSSLELRSPIMDYRLVEYSRLLPLEYVHTYQDGQKRILRDLLYRDVSKNLFMRKKQGFGIPLDSWFRDELKDEMLGMINTESLRGLNELNTLELIRMRDRHLRGEENNSTILWYVFSYLLWLRAYKSVLSIN